MTFVTGGTGFIGTHLLRELIKRHEKVRALKRTNSRILLEEEISQQIEWIEGDLLDVSSLEDGMKDCDEVYHCAATVRFLPKDRDRLMRTNIEGTANVVNTSLDNKVRKLIHVSSVAAVGRSRDDEIVDENTPWENGKHNSNYAISKFLAEREVWRGVAEGLNAVIMNPSLVMGAGNWDDGPPQMFTRIWKGLFIYTEGGTGVVAVDDVVNLMILVMKSEISGERFIVNAEHWSFKDLFFLIADQLKVKRPWLNAQPWMMDLFWRGELIRQLFSGGKPIVSKEMARIALHWSRFDNSKIVNATHYQFMPVKTCIEETAKNFLDEINHRLSKDK